ncbi:MAG TPA: 50S ribosomal protein L3 N(5)-glutamine methyltransferase [Steroidobacteraceae bacterium]|nr:50S ribosomal protein L3 N(5)-glutamine methyltransferase [Steroidobacteraceae bacterium]
MARRGTGEAGDCRDVGELLGWAAGRLRRARLHFGHGTGNATDEAAALVFHALGLGHHTAPASYRRPVGAREAARAACLVQRRIRERLPSAYLTGVTWFAGHEIRVTRDVLVPRSPIAELCRRGFEPWVRADRVRRVLDIGTGSGCIAIAAAHALPRAQVDATDVSTKALALARLNVRRHRLGRRVHLKRADVYAGLAARRYDVIVSNPPYVPASEMRRLPREHRAEPRLGLQAGAGGLAIIGRILAGARRRLKPGGILVVEAGNTAARVRRRWPRLPFTWLEFEQGDGGVFLLHAQELPE